MPQMLSSFSHRRNSGRIPTSEGHPHKPFGTKTKSLKTTEVDILILVKLTSNLQIEHWIKPSTA